MTLYTKKNLEGAKKDQNTLHQKIGNFQKLHKCKRGREPRIKQPAPIIKMVPRRVREIGRWGIPRYKVRYVPVIQRPRFKSRSFIIKSIMSYFMIREIRKNLWTKFDRSIPRRISINAGRWLRNKLPDKIDELELALHIKRLQDASNEYGVIMRKNLAKFPVIKYYKKYRILNREKIIPRVFRKRAKARPMYSYRSKIPLLRIYLSTKKYKKRYRIFRRARPALAKDRVIFEDFREHECRFILQQVNLKRGHKSKATKIVNDLILYLKKRYRGKNYNALLEYVMNRAKVLLHFRPKRVGSMIYKVPVDLYNYKAVRIIARLITAQGRSNPGKSTFDNLKEELISLVEERGHIHKRRVDMVKEANENIAYLKYIKKSKIRT